jgi:hypothetical protein
LFYQQLFQQYKYQQARLLALLIQFFQTCLLNSLIKVPELVEVHLIIPSQASRIQQKLFRCFVSILPTPYINLTPTYRALLDENTRFK